MDADVSLQVSQRDVAVARTDLRVEPGRNGHTHLDSRTPSVVAPLVLLDIWVVRLYDQSVALSKDLEVHPAYDLAAPIDVPGVHVDLHGGGAPCARRHLDVGVGHVHFELAARTEIEAALQDQLILMWS
jgi:hypothetical protein